LRFAGTSGASKFELVLMHQSGSQTGFGILIANEIHIPMFIGVTRMNTSRDHLPLHIRIVLVN